MEKEQSGLTAHLYIRFAQTDFMQLCLAVLDQTSPPDGYGPLPASCQLGKVFAKALLQKSVVALISYG